MAQKKTNEETESVSIKDEFRTPAAKLAAERGEKTYIVSIARRYKDDKTRAIQVDDHPRAVLPTEEDVEVCEAEYYELKRSATLRRETERMIEKLERETNDIGGAL